MTAPAVYRIVAHACRRLWSLCIEIDVNRYLLIIYERRYLHLLACVNGSERSAAPPISSSTHLVLSHLIADRPIVSDSLSLLLLLRAAHSGNALVNPLVGLHVDC